jgi:sugar O-acyltransferase (sialic acid O-acetyltransferase NeuD family)
MSIDRWIVVGAGGHARVVMDALQLTYPGPCHFAFVDDDVALHGQMILGQPVLGAASEFVQAGTFFHVAVGSNATRYLLHQRLMAAGGFPVAVVHPKAVVSSHAELAAATFVAAQAVIAPAAKIGIGVIVNHGAIVDHDCAVGDFCHIAPSASLAGGVTLGRQVFVGAGARVLPGVFIGDEAVIGAGAVVRADVSPNTTVVGVPARSL